MKKMIIFALASLMAFSMVACAEADTPADTNTSAEYSSTNPVAQAALERVGQYMACSELVNQSLTQAGKRDEIQKTVTLKEAVERGWGDFSTDISDYPPEVQEKILNETITITSYNIGNGTPVSLDNLQPGDVVNYDGQDHVAIYIGDDTCVHGGWTDGVVAIGPLSFSKTPTSAVRF